MRKIKMIIFVVPMMILMFGNSGQAQKLDGSPTDATDSAKILMNYFTEWINTSLSQESDFDNLGRFDGVKPLRLSSVDDLLLWGSVTGKKLTKSINWNEDNSFNYTLHGDWIHVEFEIDAHESLTGLVNPDLLFFCSIEMDLGLYKLNFHVVSDLNLNDQKRYASVVKKDFFSKINECAEVDSEKIYGNLSAFDFLHKR
jgi:hypothetical protein